MELSTLMLDTDRFKVRVDWDNTVRPGEVNWFENKARKQGAYHGEHRTV